MKCFIFTYNHSPNKQQTTNNNPQQPLATMVCAETKRQKVDLNAPYEEQVVDSAGDRVQALITSHLASIPGETIGEKFDFVANCTCCARHQTDRPRLLAPWVETEGTPFQTFSPCSCTCRHMARIICRQIS